MTQMAGVRLADRHEREIQKLIEMGLYLSVSEFIRDAVRDKLESLQIIDTRNISKDRAEEEIIDFLKKNKKAYPSDIAEALNLDINLVIGIIKELIKEGRVK